MKPSVLIQVIGKANLGLVLVWSVMVITQLKCSKPADMNVVAL